MTIHLRISPQNIDFSRINPNDSNFKKQLSKTEFSPIDRVDDLLPDDRAKFMVHWNAIVIEIQVVLDEMRKRGFSGLDIEEESDALYTQLYIKGNQFLDQTELNRQTCRDWHIRAEDFEERLKEISLKYPDFNLSPAANAPNVMSMIKKVAKTELQCGTPSVLKFPSDGKLLNCLERHPVMDEPYLQKQGIILAVAQVFGDQEKIQSNIDLGLMNVLDQRDQLSDQTKESILGPLKEALEDCTK